jgi:hypothetical protein
MSGATLFMIGLCVRSFYGSAPPPGGQPELLSILFVRRADDRNYRWFCSAARRQTKTGTDSSLPPGGRNV